MTPQAILQSYEHQGIWYEYYDCVDEIQCFSPGAVMESLRQVEAGVCKHQCYAIGFVTYEAASGFDAALKTHELPSHFPYLHFSLFKKRKRYHFNLKREPSPLLSWESDTNPSTYLQSVDTLKKYIGIGETYQVNFTYRFTSESECESYHLFQDLVLVQNPRYGGYLHAKNVAVCSASPELFFSLDGNDITCKPMKGTIERGKTAQLDRERHDALLSSGKDRSENIMIVDMIRNDLSKIALCGSVVTTNLCELTAYPNVWQMTSTVKARTESPTSDIFRALFPCASITGAPKVRTMELIAGSEKSPRKVYCGAFGLIAPNRKSYFNVAIRTALCDMITGRIEFGVGSGITIESDSKQELVECENKSSIILQTNSTSNLSLFETLRWSREEGFFLLSDHLERIKYSASCFNFPFDSERFMHALQYAVGEVAESIATYKVKILLRKNGKFHVECEEINLSRHEFPQPVVLAKSPVSRESIFLYHKTTNRASYDAHTIPAGVQDVLLWNTQGELTESIYSNIVALRNGKLLTPPVSSGLLAGTYRASMLREGILTEEVLYADDIASYEALYLVNSVRGMREVYLAELRDNKQERVIATGREY